MRFYRNGAAFYFIDGKENALSDQEARLAVAELKLEHHDKLHEETQSAIRELTNAITTLVQAEIRREQDEDTFRRIFTSIDKLRSDFEEYKDRQTEKELAAYRGVVVKVAGLGALVVASVAAGHFGAPLLG